MKYIFLEGTRSITKRDSLAFLDLFTLSVAADPLCPYVLILIPLHCVYANCQPGDKYDLLKGFTAPVMCI